jgi:AhpD family alkylhydroperoxidase
MEQITKSIGTLMEPRLQHSKIAPQGFQAALQLHNYVTHCGLERSLLDLINVRASQINGCAYCIDIHAREARAAGESEQRLYALSAWREAPFYSDRERAALAWTEAVTRISIDNVSDEIYEQARRYFSEKELVDLTLAVASINTFNRLSTSFRNPVPGRFTPPAGPSREDQPSQSQSHSGS